MGRPLAFICYLNLTQFGSLLEYRSDIYQMINDIIDNMLEVGTPKQLG